MKPFLEALNVGECKTAQEGPAQWAELIARLQRAIKAAEKPGWGEGEPLVSAP
jgi:hypothetical protein